MSDEPFPVLLMECFLAGFPHHAAARCWSRLAIGETLTLAREPANPHDARAVRVEWRGACLGYLPREASFAASQMLDRGEALFARIAAKRPDADPRTRLLLQVIVQADASRALPAACSGERDAVPDPAPAPDGDSPPHENKVILGLAWMLAGKAIGKAKG